MTPGPRWTQTTNRSADNQAFHRYTRGPTKYVSLTSEMKFDKKTGSQETFYTTPKDSNHFNVFFSTTIN